MSTKLSVLLTAAHAAPTYIFKNECDFSLGVKTTNGMSTQVASGQSSSALSLQGGSRIYFGPDGWAGLGTKEYLGFLEYSGDGEFLDLSYVDFIGLPMQMQCKGGPLYGCGSDPSDGYTTYDAFQKSVKDNCPTGAKSISYSKNGKTGTMSYCSSPAFYEGDVCSTPIVDLWDIKSQYTRKWNLPQGGTKSASDIGSDCGFPTGDKCTAIKNVDGCKTHCFFSTVQSDQAPNEICADMNRGSDKSDDPTTFYKGYDPSLKKAAFKFNPYAAFVHTQCGAYSGYAFPTDEHGQGPRGNYGSMGGCSSEVTVTFCPSKPARRLRA